MIYYKIRNKDSGLFSTGGTRPRWKKIGKIWKRKQDLTSHFNMLPTYTGPYINCEVVEYTVSETGIQSIYDWISHSRQRRLLKESQRQMAAERYTRELRRRQYEELKREFEKPKDVDGHG